MEALQWVKVRKGQKSMLEGDPDLFIVFFFSGKADARAGMK